jgi:DNA-directed RNA polymerase
MQQFTGYEYIQIDIANNFGLDKEIWSERLAWVRDNENKLEGLVNQADSPVLYHKAVTAYRDVQKGKPTGHLMGLDATASGLQVLACLTGCSKTAEAVNLTPSSQRKDVYQEVAGAMSEALRAPVNRSQVKKPLMTHYYQSQAVPKQEFNPKQLKAFYVALKGKMPGAENYLALVKQYWNPEAKYYEWTMPDGHYVKIPVIGVESKRIEIDELDHFKMQFQTTVVKPKGEGRSLAGNIVHSVDAYICRMMVRLAHEEGFDLLPIHDCFYAHPNYMNQVRQNYIDICSHIAEMNLLADILDQMSGTKSHYKPEEYVLPPLIKLSDLIKRAEYALS